MKKIKKLTLNKEVVSIIGENDMNLVKGGTGYTFTCEGGGGGPGDLHTNACTNTCHTCANTCANTACGTTCLAPCQNGLTVIRTNGCG